MIHDHVIPGLKLCAVALTIALTGCGTITQGTSQDIAVSSSPSGARCDFEREGQILGTILETPGRLTVKKTKHDILLKCTLAGYQPASQYLKSGYGAGTFGNILLGGGIGWAIDSATGSDNHYPKTATVTFVPASAAPSKAQTPPVEDKDKGVVVKERGEDIKKTN